MSSPNSKCQFHIHIQALALSIALTIIFSLCHSTGIASTSAVKTYTMAEIKKARIHLLVNKYHKLPKNYKAANLASISKKVPVRFAGLKLNSQALIYLRQMYLAAKKKGINIYVYSGYRTFAEQTRLFNNKVKFYQQNHTKAEAIKLASKIVAPPNTSEHQTGLAVDLLSTKYRVRDSGFVNSEAGKWLKANGWKFGFILRYPSTKVKITEIIFEPWHYRFVGKIQAKKMHLKKVCLEEYAALEAK